MVDERADRSKSLKQLAQKMQNLSGGSFKNLVEVLVDSLLLYEVYRRLAMCKVAWVDRNGSDASSENFMVVGEAATMVHDLAISDEHAAGEM